MRVVDGRQKATGHLMPFHPCRPTGVRRQYVLQSVRDYDTAALFLEMVGRFRGYAGAHGASAEGNPSGGNVYRGLYNIALKSLGNRHVTAM